MHNKRLKLPGHFSFVTRQWIYVSSNFLWYCCLQLWSKNFAFREQEIAMRINTLWNRRSFTHYRKHTFIMINTQRHCSGSTKMRLFKVYVLIASNNHLNANSIIPVYGLNLCEGLFERLLFFKWSDFAFSWFRTFGRQNFLCFSSWNGLHIFFNF